jgi:hypothetical protein
VSRDSSDLRLTNDALSEDAVFDCRATASLLRAVGVLVWAAHVGAVLAISRSQLFPLLGWGMVVYFAVRMRLDAELLELLAGDPRHAPAKLDQWLSKAGLRAPGVERSIGDRCQGARRLARWLVFALIGQAAATALVLLRSNL